MPTLFSAKNARCGKGSAMNPEATGCIQLPPQHKQHVRSEALVLDYGSLPGCASPEEAQASIYGELHINCRSEGRGKIRSLPG